MKDANRIGCPKLDGPEVSQTLFYPRSSWKEPVSQEGVRDILIPVGDGVSVGARFHTVNKQGPSILFFHGNGEIVEDYEDIALLYIRMGLNFRPVDYRGYGHSTGQPSVSAMLRDAYGANVHIFKTEIPMCVRAAESPSFGKSIFDYDPRGKATLAYEQLAREVLTLGRKKELGRGGFTPTR